MTSISLGLHVLFVSLLVGGQLLLFFAVVPATWLIDDERLRRAVTRVVTARFGMFAGVSLAGLLVTGLFQFYNDDVVPSSISDNMLDFRWGQIFMTKMTLFVVLIVLIGVHGIYFGRRIREASEAVETGEGTTAELESLRRRSLMFSVLMVVVSIMLVLLGATLGNPSYSYQPT